MSNLKINMNSIEDVKNSLNSHTLRVCVIDIGRYSSTNSIGS